MSENGQKRITLGKESNEHTRRLKRSIRKVKWLRSLMQIIWTAGPVTTIGLIGGYYIGYGTMPSIQLLIYFVSFTVFSGLVGLIAKVIYDGTRGHLEEQSEQDILQVTGKLGDLILISRDKVVQAYEGDSRQREAALQLLRRVDLTPYGVTIAFSDLTGDREVGEIMGKIFAYRRIGLQTKVRELYTENREQIEKIARDLASKSPQAARELKQWFTGNTPARLKYGIPRERFFLQRVMSAIENNNPHLMTFRDVEEMMILAFELICGREIPTLTFAYSGRWKFATALDELERKRSQYRVSQARGGNRMRALSAYLIEAGIADAEELPEGLTMKELSDKVTRIVDRLALQMRAALRDQKLPDKEMERLLNVMNTSNELYNMAYNGYKESSKQHVDLLKATEKWKKIAGQSSLQSGMFTFGRGRKGIRIKENVIALNEEARLEVCRHLAWFFEKEDIKNKSHVLFYSFNNRGAMSARRLAIEIAVALEPHIHLSRPEIQRNINATKAIYLGSLSPDLSSVQKQELGTRMAQEADNGLATAAIRLAETLVFQYKVDLSDEAIDFLNYNYSAGRKTLERIANKERTITGTAETEYNIPPIVKPPKNEWEKISQQVRKTLNRSN